MDPKADEYFLDGCGRCSKHGTPECKVNTWRKELALLRSILNDSGLTEELKWRAPCYTSDGKNIALLGAFKDYCCLSFFKGVLLKDPEGILTFQGENSRTVKIMRFTNLQDISDRVEMIRSYIKEAIALEKAGKKVPQLRAEEILVPAELLKKFGELPALEKAFNALTPGRKRSYILHISSAKQENTRYARIERCIPSIFSGKGFNE